MNYKEILTLRDFFNVILNLWYKTEKLKFSNTIILFEDEIPPPLLKVSNQLFY